MSLLTSPDERCLFCTSSLARYPIVEGQEASGEDRTLEILWSDCLECGFSVPTSAPDLDLVLGDREEVERLIEEDRAVLLLPSEAAVHFHPAEPAQLLQACREAGFREVHLELLGDELVAERYLEHWEASGEDETWIRSTSSLVVQYLRLRHPGLLGRLVPVVTPAEAAARQLRASLEDDVEVIYASMSPPVGSESSYVPFTVERLQQLLADRQLDLSEMPEEFPDGDVVRRRHHSVPGGLPRKMLEEPNGGPGRIHQVRDLEGLSEVAEALEAGTEEFGFVDALPFEDNLAHPGLGEPHELFRRREIAGGLEGERSDGPVVEPAEGLDLTASFEEGEVPTLKLEDAAPTLARMGVRLQDLMANSRRTLATCPYRMADRYQDALEDIRHDAVTGGLAHRAFRDRLNEEVSRATRYGTRIALLFVELDSYEERVEEHGRDAGKALMGALGEIVDGSTRDTDVLGRIGKARTGVILIDPTPEGVAKVADKVRSRVEETTMDVDGTSLEGTTVSIGLAYHPGESRAAVTAEDLFAEADAAVYIALAQGGNRIHPSNLEELTRHES